MRLLLQMVRGERGLKVRGSSLIAGTLVETACRKDHAPAPAPAPASGLPLQRSRHEAPEIIWRICKFTIDVRSIAPSDRTATNKKEGAVLMRDFAQLRVDICTDPSFQSQTSGDIRWH